MKCHYVVLLTLWPWSLTFQSQNHITFSISKSHFLHQFWTLWDIRFYPNVTTLHLANGMANQSVRLSSVCRLWRACTLLRGFNFSGIFLHHIVAWPSGNLPTKNHEDRVKQANSHVWLSLPLMSFLLSYATDKQTNRRSRTTPTDIHREP